MSTRIYKGFRLETGSFAEAMRIVEAFRPWVVVQAEQLLDNFMENLAKEGKDAIQAYDTWQDLRERVRVKQQRIPHVDTEFCVVLIPSAGALLGIVYTEHSSWFGAWCEQPGVSEYYFWDNADPPEDITEPQWTEREKAWSVMTHLPVSTQGFAIELVSPSGPHPKAWRK